MNDAELLAIIAQAEREGWTELDLSGNDLEGLPSEIGRLQSLEKLILGKWDSKEGKSKIFGNVTKLLKGDKVEYVNKDKKDGNRSNKMPNLWTDKYLPTWT